MTDEDKALYIQMRTGSHPDEDVVGGNPKPKEPPPPKDKRGTRWVQSEIDEAIQIWDKLKGTFDNSSIAEVISEKIGRPPGYIEKFMYKFGAIRARKRGQMKIKANYNE